MTLNHLTPCKTFEIWQPRWKDRVVLMADYKIGTHNQITFKAKSLEVEWYISGKDAKSYPQTDFITKTGTTMIMREVPLAALEPLERVYA